MGAQQMKCSNEQYMLSVDKKERLEKNSLNKDDSKLIGRIPLNEISETAMSQHEQKLISSPMDKITVADFAKIKVEYISLDEHTNEPTVLKLNDASQNEPINKKAKSELLYNTTEKSSECDCFGPVTDVKLFLEKETIIENVSFATVAELKPVIEIKAESLKSINLQADVVSENNSPPQITIDSYSETCDRIGLPIKSEIIPVNNQHQCKDIFDTTEKEYNTSMPLSRERHMEMNKSPSQPINIKETKNLKKPHVIDIIESNDPQSLSNDTFNTYSAIKKEIYYNTSIVKKTKIEKLVKNPLAFFKKKRRKVSLEDNNLCANSIQKNFLNNSIKSESISIDIDLKLETANCTEGPNSSTDVNENNVVLKDLADQSSTDFSEISIKAETPSISEYNQVLYKSTSSNINCLTCNFDTSSLDVNLSNEDSDIEGLESNVSINNTTGYSKYFSITEISTEDNAELPVQYPQLIETIKTPKQQKPHQKNINNLKKQHKGQVKRNIKKPKRYTDKDAASRFSKAKKNLPKTKKKLEKKVIKPIRKKPAAAAREKFPRPLKLELERLTLQKEHSVTIELPKPMMFKTESCLNIKNKKLYQKPEFQPRVRLQRIKSEELLVPLKTKCVRTSHKCKSVENVNKRSINHQITTANRSDLLIHRAYSLNTCTKLNRSSVDHDHYYCNERNSLNNSLTSSYGLPTYSSAAFFNEPELKYFSQQETDASSTYNNGPIDSGDSISAPTSPHHSSECNRTILFEIAAERAFINNHLMHFGYSPIQFDLYNNVNDLSVFLKYLLGNMNTN